MTRWRAYRLIIRTSGYLVGILAVTNFAQYVVSTPAHNWGNSHGRTILLYFLAGLIVALCLIPAVDAVIRPRAWKEHSNQDFEWQTAIIRITRELCGLKHSRTVTLTVSGNARLVCAFPDRRQIFEGFWQFVAFGRAPQAYLKFEYGFPGDDPEATLPEGQVFHIGYFGGSYHGMLADPEFKLDQRDYAWLLVQLKSAVATHANQPRPFASSLKTEAGGLQTWPNKKRAAVVR